VKASDLESSQSFFFAETADFSRWLHECSFPGSLIHRRRFRRNPSLEALPTLSRSRTGAYLPSLPVPFEFLPPPVRKPSFITSLASVFFLHLKQLRQGLFPFPKSSGLVWWSNDLFLAEGFVSGAVGRSSFSPFMLNNLFS